MIVTRAVSNGEIIDCRQTGAERKDRAQQRLQHLLPAHPLQENRNFAQRAEWSIIVIESSADLEDRSAIAL